MRQIRQGDVLLVRVGASPADFLRSDATLQAVEQLPGRVVLAEGEATGHAHVIVSGEARLVTRQEADELYLLVYGRPSVALEHPEHDPLPLEPGVYRVIRQREHREADEWDWVRD